MDHNGLRQAYLNFFIRNSHKLLPSAKLIPENDPSTLFNSSGMQPLIPYLMGQTHPEGKRLVNSQVCFRAEDMDEIGDNRHTTFFEMLGNWSLGDYFKKEQLTWVYHFLTEIVGLPKERLAFTCFEGNDEIPRDTESADIWKSLGVPSKRIFYYGVNKNWWSRSGAPDKMPVGEIGGVDSEVFYEFDQEHDEAFGPECHPNCDCGRYFEIGNSVFIEYQKQADGKFIELKQKNVDFGGGLLRLLAVLNNSPDVFKTDLIWPIISRIEELSRHSYQSKTSEMRVIADHITGSVFMISEGLEPGNKQQGYILRRLIRRMVIKGFQIGLEKNFTKLIVPEVISIYRDVYPSVVHQAPKIEQIIDKEETKFRNTLKRGLSELERYVQSDQKISGQILFNLYQSYGFPLEISQEMIQEKNLPIEDDAVETCLKKIEDHRNLSRSSSVGMFKGGLADSSQETTQLHTVHHLLLAGLRRELGDKVVQRGSNITQERLRIDVSCDQKISSEVLEKVENWVNDAISKKLNVTFESLPVAEALKTGALGEFGARYGETVKVYTISDPSGKIWSKEICGGPHVSNTSELGKFEIIKEEASGSGIRRIKAVLKPRD